MRGRGVLVGVPVAIGIRVGVDEGGVAVDLVLIDVNAVVLIGVVNAVLRVGLGAVLVDVVRLVLVVDVLRVLGGVGGGGGGEVLRGGVSVVGVVRRDHGVVLIGPGRPAAGELGGEERVETQRALAVGALGIVGGAGHSAAGGGSHEVFPYLSP